MSATNASHPRSRQRPGAPSPPPAPDPSGDRYYAAVVARDIRFDGRFFTAVRTTGIYCRPICPARTPKRENVLFYACAAAAEAAGYRPCRRCRPDASPGSPEWRGTSSTVSRALRLIADGALDERSVADLAARLGVGERHLHRLFLRHLGAPPIAVAQTRRAHIARRLTEETSEPLTEIAFAAGFASLRRFRAVFQRTFGCSPSALRAAARGGASGRRTKRGTTASAGNEGTAHANGSGNGSGNGSATSTRSVRAENGPGPALTALTVPVRSPFDWDSLLEFLRPRCLPGVESVDGFVYRRRIGEPGAHGWIEVHPAAGRDALLVRTDQAPSRELLRLVERVQDVFDLNADGQEIGDHLARDGTLAPLVRAHPGMRVPGIWDGFELAVRAVLGQQVSVAAARTLAARLVTQLGAIRPDRLAEADLSSLGVPAARARTLLHLARATLDGSLTLEPWGDPEATRAALRSLPGIGPWTCEYIAMRALRDPDAFPASDLGVRKALGRGGAPCSAAEAERRAEAWRPWRAYAVIYLWRSL